MKMRKREKRILAAIGLALYATGATLFVLTRWIRVATQVGEQHSPMELTVRVLHVAVAYLIVLGVGYLLHSHVRPGLKSRARKRRASGLAFLALPFLLMASAICILYGGDAEWVTVVSWAHAILGIGSPLLLAVHLVS